MKRRPQAFLRFGPKAYKSICLTRGWRHHAVGSSNSEQVLWLALSSSTTKLLYYLPRAKAGGHDTWRTMQGLEGI